MESVTYKISCPYCSSFCGMVRKEGEELRCSRLWHYDLEGEENKRGFRPKRYKLPPDDPARLCLDWRYKHRRSLSWEQGYRPKWVQCIVRDDQTNGWIYDPVGLVWKCKYDSMTRLCRALGSKIVYVWRPLPEDIGWHPASPGRLDEATLDMLAVVEGTLGELAEAPRLRAHPATTRTAGHRGAGTVVVPCGGGLGPGRKQLILLQRNPLVKQVVIVAMPEGM